MGIDIGDGFGTGTGDGDGGGIPGIISKPLRFERPHEAHHGKRGHPRQCEEAVVKSLRWLKKTARTANGSWGEGQFRASMTGISLSRWRARPTGSRISGRRRLPPFHGRFPRSGG
ncbi:hypothetical protein [Akkermansia muciniphila]|uniref:hypothetical protein n=1 Tax=Akkermansia muciniphila TaxID=239935 RepID=UPI001F09103F|nr:hypothetical protein [Akkermansia muciniphila]